MSVRLSPVVLVCVATVLGSPEGWAQATTPEAPTETSPPAAPPSPQPALPVPAQPAPTTAQPAPGAAPAAPSTVPATTAQPAAPQPGQGTPATVLSLEDSDGIIGKGVRSATGEDMGRIVDVIVTGNTQPRAAVIDFGGFLGVGSRKVAVDWRSVQFATDGRAGRITVALTRNQVRATPEYKAGEPIVVIGSPPPAREASAPEPVPAPAKTSP